MMDLLLSKSLKTVARQSAAKVIPMRLKKKMQSCNMNHSICFDL